jgi:hypothetical protein
MRNDLVCRCGRSLALICALFASLAAAVLLAEDHCLDGGGRVSGAAWMCELGPGASQSLWTQVSPASVAFVVLAVGLPTYLVVAAVARRWLAR